MVLFLELKTATLSLFSSLKPEEHTNFAKLQSAIDTAVSDLLGQSAYLTFVGRLHRLLCDLQLPTAPFSA